MKQYENKKIAILGYGIEGKALFEYLRQKGVEATVLDQTGEAEFAKANPDFQGKSQLGINYLQRLREFDLVFKSPGIPYLTTEIQDAIKAGVIVTSLTELFFKEVQGVVIGVTGTKGKGTTSTLIYQILKNSGKKVFLGGNIGVPAVSFLDRTSDDTISVLELSSFQLQPLKQSPHIAVLLNVTSDHLDHHRSIEEYREAKANILRYQTKDDFAVLNADYEVPMELAKSTKAIKRFFSRKKPVEGCYVKDGVVYLQTDSGVAVIAEKSDLKLRGEHNLENITAAIEASILAGADITAIQKTVKEFVGLEHRLELVRKIDGVEYYNDSFSTVPETAIAAIKSFDEPKILILGGSDKGSDYKELGRVIANSNTKAVILIGAMAENIEKSLVDFQGKIIKDLSGMKEIVAEAKRLAGEGDVVLLTPACASFGLFKNYKDRGNQFKEAVNDLE